MKPFKPQTTKELNISLLVNKIFMWVWVIIPYFLFTSLFFINTGNRIIDLIIMGIFIKLSFYLILLSGQHNITNNLTELRLELRELKDKLIKE